MTKLIKFTTCGIAAILLTGGTAFAGQGPGGDGDTYCMDVVVEPFHMEVDGSCAVKDFLGGRLQEMFYPFTEEEHLFNCDYFGLWTPLPSDNAMWSEVAVPSSVSGVISGTIDGFPFEADLLCASMTNWYQDYCADPDDPQTCSFQLAQPFLKMGKPFPSITEVSVFDGIVENDKGKGIPIVMATRASGIMHEADLASFEVGASITHSALGLVTIRDNDKDKGKDRINIKRMDASADLLLQGHIFSPDAVEDDPGAAIIKGSICSKDLYKALYAQRSNGDDDDLDD